MKRPCRVAVLGGGAAALAAAFELSDPVHAGRFEVTVRTLGWRLGGKGASGRDARRHQRIEEHGLHLWFGFYEESLDLMRRVYAEAGAAAPAPSAARAFAPVEELALWDRAGTPGEWTRWTLPLPHAQLEDRRPEPLDPGDYARAIASWLLAVWEARPRGITDATEPPPPALRAAAAPATVGMEEDRVALLVAAARDLASRGSGLRLLAELCDFWAALLGRLRSTGALGLDGFDAAVLARMDEEDFREWLTPALLFRSTRDAPFLRALYDLIFAYVAGDRARPRAAAGMMARNVIRLAFEHRGSLMLRMKGGMGDVIFAPLHHALTARGVRIELFRAVTGIGQRDGVVDWIDVVDQVDLARKGYDPFERIGDEYAWPSQPRWEQLAQGPQLQARGVDLEREHNPLGREPRRLERAAGDFDAVVLGIPVGALGGLGAELAAAHEPFARMLASAVTVPTQAAQLWLTSPAPGGGLAPSPGAVTGAYDPPFDTCAEFSHLLTHEPWPPGSEVAQVAYLVGVLSAELAREPDPVRRQREGQAHVLDRVREFVERHPRADELRDALADPGGRPGGAVTDQYWRANVAGAEQYVLSPPGTMADRLAPGESGFANLALAGDWTRTAIDAGCVEAAVASGRRAAQAIADWEGSA